MAIIIIIIVLLLLLLLVLIIFNRGAPKHFNPRSTPSSKQKIRVKGVGFRAWV